MDRLIQSTNSVGETKSFTYDANGNLIETLDAKGQVITFDYDAVNQLITKILLPGAPDEAVTTFTYDDVNNLTSVTDPDSALGLTYDLVSRLITSSTQGSPVQPDTLLNYTYDANGNRLSMTDSLLGTTSYTYDALNRLVSLSTQDSALITFSYDNLSRRTLLTLPNGTEAVSSYSGASQLLSLVSRLTALPGTLIAQADYTYDQVGNRKTLQDLTGLHTFTYDGLSRLTGAAHPPASALPLESFSYDSVGNRTSSHLSVSQTYNTANRLLEDDTFTYTYDGNGNLTSKTDKNTSEVTTYTYDPEDQLVRIDFPDSTFAEYAYDGLGRRIEKDVSGAITRYVYDNEDILLEFDGFNVLQASYTHGPGIDEPLIMERAGQSFYYHTDGLGSITDITDSTASTVQSYRYDTFGQIINQAGASTNPYTYTGREFDPESGLYYYRSRYYDPGVGRFLSEDPLKLGSIISDLLMVRAFMLDFNLSFSESMLLHKVARASNFTNEEAQALSLHLRRDTIMRSSYMYVANNPVNVRDPLGTFTPGIPAPGPPLPGSPSDPVESCPLPRPDTDCVVVCKHLENDDAAWFECLQGWFEIVKGKGGGN